MRPIKLERVRRFAVSDASTRSALESLEEAVARAVDSLSLERLPRFTLRQVDAATCVAGLWEMLVPIGDCAVMLPSPTAGNACAEIRVVRPSAALVVVTSPATINGSSALTIPSQRMRGFISTGKAWFSYGAD